MKKGEGFILKFCAQISNERLFGFYAQFNTIAQFVTGLLFISYRKRGVSMNSDIMSCDLQADTFVLRVNTVNFCRSPFCGSSFVAQRVLETQMKGSGTLILKKNDVTFTFETQASL